MYGPSEGVLYLSQKFALTPNQFVQQVVFLRTRIYIFYIFKMQSYYRFGINLNVHRVGGVHEILFTRFLRVIGDITYIYFIKHAISNHTQMGFDI